jgi:hypothetical protein
MPENVTQIWLTVHGQVIQQEVMEPNNNEQRTPLMMYGGWTQDNIVFVFERALAAGTACRMAGNIAMGYLKKIWKLMMSQHQMSDRGQLEPVARLIQLPFWSVGILSAYVLLVRTLKCSRRHAFLVL